LRLERHCAGALLRWPHASHFSSSALVRTRNGRLPGCPGSSRDLPQGGPAWAHVTARASPWCSRSIHRSLELKIRRAQGFGRRRHPRPVNAVELSDWDAAYPGLATRTCESVKGGAPRPIHEGAPEARSTGGAPQAHSYYSTQEIRGHPASAGGMSNIDGAIHRCLLPSPWSARSRSS
jgi:hypothetical protein